jgi:ArsR family transcriptional regulator, lead/cadmium/zinc/bismuth-responsive transcriptional repressor
MTRTVFCSYRPGGRRGCTWVGSGPRRPKIGDVHQGSAAPGDPPVVDPSQVCDARAVLADGPRLRAAAATLGAVGETNRLSMLLALRHAGDLCVSDLAVAVGMSDSAVSHALRLLRAHGMVSAHRQGRLVRYRVTGELTVRLLDLVSEDVVGDVVLHAHDTNGAHPGG